MPVILGAHEAEIKRTVVQSQSRQIVWKYPTQNRAGGVAQVEECLPSKCEALSLKSSTTKNLLSIP
jgi:hypothetical protein